MKNEIEAIEKGTAMIAKTIVIAFKRNKLKSKKKAAMLYKHLK